MIETFEDFYDFVVAHIRKNSPWGHYPESVYAFVEAVVLAGRTDGGIEELKCREPDPIHVAAFRGMNNPSLRPIPTGLVEFAAYIYDDVPQYGHWLRAAGHALGLFSRRTTYLVELHTRCQCVLVSRDAFHKKFRARVCIPIHAASVFPVPTPEETVEILKELAHREQIADPDQWVDALRPPVPSPM